MDAEHPAGGEVHAGRHRPPPIRGRLSPRGTTGSEYPTGGGTTPMGPGPGDRPGAIPTSRGRRVIDPRVCARCSGVIPAERSSLSPYCSSVCRTRAKRSRKEAGRRARRRDRVLSCERCGVEIVRPASARGPLPRFCSEVCQRRRPARSCEVCATSSDERPGNWRRWCSQACRERAARVVGSTGRPAPIRRPAATFCNACGALFMPRDRRSRFCSSACRMRWQWPWRPVPARRAKSRRAHARRRVGAQ